MGRGIQWLREQLEADGKVVVVFLVNLVRICAQRAAG